MLVALYLRLGHESILSGVVLGETVEARSSIVFAV